MEDTIKQVMEITGYAQAKAEKYFKQVKKDLCEDVPETTDEDVMEVIRIEKKAKDNGVKNVGRAEKKKPTVYKFDTEKSKSRKKDEEKVEIVQKVADFLAEFVENAEVVNAGQKISFQIGENSYSFTLTKHRNAKN